MEQANREKRVIPFSYLDVFFLLLAFLIGSVIVYVVMESRPATADPVTCEIEAQTLIEDWMIAHTPEAGDPVFSEMGAVCGTILAVHTESGPQGRLFVFTYRQKADTPPQTGTVTVLQTSDFSHGVTVQSVRVLQEAE